MPVITYTAGIIDWTKEELRELDTKTRKRMTIYKALHPRADIDRLYIPRKKGGRGLLSVEDMVTLEKTSLSEYVNGKPEQLMELLEKEGLTKYTMPKEKKKKEIQGKRETRWREKALHGKWAETIDETDPRTSQWLSTANLKPVTEALITAAQDQALNTNWHAHNIIKNKSVEKCRACNEHPETVAHIVSGCPRIAQTLYLKRHNAVAATVHWGLCEATGFERAEHWWQHQPETALENESFKLLYDFNVLTDKKITARRPDIIVVDKKKQTYNNYRCFLPSRQEYQK